MLRSCRFFPAPCREHVTFTVLATSKYTTQCDRRAVPQTPPNGRRSVPVPGLPARGSQHTPVSPRSASADATPKRGPTARVRRRGPRPQAPARFTRGAERGRPGRTAWPVPTTHVPRGRSTHPRCSHEHRVSSAGRMTVPKAGWVTETKHMCPQSVLGGYVSEMSVSRGPHSLWR